MEHSGQCHCGHCIYTIAGEPSFQGMCYCTDCRVLNGAGHLAAMGFSKEGLTPAQGTKVYSYPGGSGEAIEMHFCPECSTQLYAFPQKYPGVVIVRANTANADDFKPQINLFEEEAFAWDKPQAV